MNCKQTREAIDMASRRNPYGDAVTSHLSGCPDCRRHADEANSLLTLLSAQPRVQAPADFDFRLRARIARAQAEQASPAGLLEQIWQNFFAKTFSWGQAASAIAAVALVVTVSTFYINHDNSAPVTNDNIATVITPTEAPQAVMESAPETKTPVVESVGPAPVKLSNRGVKATPASVKPEASETIASSIDIARANNSPRFYNRETRQFVPDRDSLFGAEAASANSAKMTMAALTF